MAIATLHNNVLTICDTSECLIAGDHEYRRRSGDRFVSSDSEYVILDHIKDAKTMRVGAKLLIPLKSFKAIDPEQKKPQKMGIDENALSVLKKFDPPEEGVCQAETEPRNEYKVFVSEKDRQLSNFIKRSRNCRTKSCIRNALHEEMPMVIEETNEMLWDAAKFAITGLATGGLLSKIPAVIKAALILGSAAIDDPKAVGDLNIDDLKETFGNDPIISLAVSATTVAGAYVLTKLPATKSYAETALRWIFTGLLGKAHFERIAISFDPESDIREKGKLLGGKMGELSIFTLFSGISAVSEAIKMSPVMGQILCLPDDTIFLAREVISESK